MCGLEFICLSGFFALIVYAIYLYAHDRGQQQGRQQVLDSTFGRKMEQFWAQQDFRREAGLPYLNDDLEYMENE